ncbi:MAG: type IX secretion system outer membrane channel protein PorV [Chitinophagales bacterium]|nr:type IX secretion system outer membrane channel protein PorV [Chitinophagales bacterium]
MKSNFQLRTVSIFIVMVTVCSSVIVNAQTAADSLDGRVNVINTAVPFLRITPDARSGAMGDVGVALSADANAVFWNTAKIPFATKKLALGVTYTPWLRALVNDIYLASLGGYYKVDDNSALAFGLRYFSLGSITFTSTTGNVIGDFNPQEFAIDLGYARKLANHLSVGLNLGFVYSNLAASYVVNNVPIKAGKAVKADISTIYNHPAKFGKIKGSYSIGATIANIGNKITYTESAENKDFLPCNLGLGTDLTFQFDDYNKLSFNLDLNKLLVPTPDSAGTYRSLGVAEGIFTSFTDAPGGFSEEMREIMISTGAEYWYRELFAVRAGFFYEDPTKGARQYITAGFGIKYNVFGLNFSYLIPTSSQKTPLDNTLRFSLLFDFDALKKVPEEAPTESE